MVSYYRLQEEARGPAGGFVYSRQKNRRGDEIGGVVPHITLGNLANNEPTTEEIRVDCPDIDETATRVAGPFCIEATIPTPLDWDSDSEASDAVHAETDDYGSYRDRMLNVLRRAPVLQVGGW